MRQVIVLLVVCLLGVPALEACGLCVPKKPSLPPLALVNHRVETAVTDQVAITTVEQTFRNNSTQEIEATYLFPVPRGATINKFSMWVNGKEETGELLDAAKAKEIYTSVVRQSKDPALLEYLGQGILRVNIFPVPPKSRSNSGDVKIKLSYTALLPKDGNVVEYTYPLQGMNASRQTLEEFSIKLKLTGQDAIQSVYSPTHAIDTTRQSDKSVSVEFTKQQANLNRDFQLFYSQGNASIGLTPLLYRPNPKEDGFFCLLISPVIEAAKEQRVPRDLVLVLDTSGSMTDTKMSQAKQALRKVLKQLGEHPEDRFGLIAFSTTVRPYQDKLVEATTAEIDKAIGWIDTLKASGGTAILPALNSALELRDKTSKGVYQVAFFTDGQPTVDERDPKKILTKMTDKNTEGTRIFTFGVGDDVNAMMLDELASSTRALSTYVRPSESIETKATALAAKMAHPVLGNVRLSSNNVRFYDISPQQMPDLFHGSQFVVMGRYSGAGPTTVWLHGTLGDQEYDTPYEIDFAKETNTERSFVEPIWAGRKVAYLLDQIRQNGESEELVKEVTELAKKYSIATPYTSYLVMPDTPMPVARPGMGGEGPAPAAPPGGVEIFAKEIAKNAPRSAGNKIEVAQGRGGVQEKALNEQLAQLSPKDRNSEFANRLRHAQEQAKTFDAVKQNYTAGGARLDDNRRGKLGVDLAVVSNELRAQDKLRAVASQQRAGRNVIELGGVWVDDQFDNTTKTVNVKAQSDAYFALLEAHPKLKDVYTLGNALVWLTPSGTALVIDPRLGDETLSREAIQALFTAKK